jgi:hypothetical protein
MPPRTKLDCNIIFKKVDRIRSSEEPGHMTGFRRLWGWIGSISTAFWFVPLLVKWVPLLAIGYYGLWEHHFVVMFIVAFAYHKAFDLALWYTFRQTNKPSGASVAPQLFAEVFKA